MKVGIFLIAFTLLFVIAADAQPQSSEGACSPNIVGEKNAVHCNLYRPKPVNALLVMHQYFQKLGRRYVQKLNCASAKGTGTRAGQICHSLAVGVMESYDAEKYRMAFGSIEYAANHTNHEGRDLLPTAFLIKGYSAFLSRHFSGLAPKSFEWASYYNRSVANKEMGIEILFGRAVSYLGFKKCDLAEIFIAQYMEAIKASPDDDLVVKDADRFVDGCR